MPQLLNTIILSPVFSFSLVELELRRLFNLNIIIEVAVHLHFSFIACYMPIVQKATEFGNCQHTSLLMDDASDMKLAHCMIHVCYEIH